MVTLEQLRAMASDHIRLTDPRVVGPAIALAGKHGWTDLRAEVEAHLHHPSGCMREEAIKTLLYCWNLSEFVPHAHRMIYEDPDLDTRAAALFWWGDYHGDRPRNQAVIDELIDLLTDPEQDERIHAKAYAGLLRQTDMPRREIPFVWPECMEWMVDWDLVQRLSEGA